MGIPLYTRQYKREADWEGAGGTADCARRSDGDPFPFRGWWGGHAVVSVIEVLPILWDVMARRAGGHLLRRYFQCSRGRHGNFVSKTS